MKSSSASFFFLFLCTVRDDCTTDAWIPSHVLRVGGGSGGVHDGQKHHTRRQPPLTLKKENNLRVAVGVGVLSSSPSWLLLLRAVPGADIEQPPVSDSSSSARFSDASSELSTVARRGKVNEIDFCIAPADVSLSRAYGTAATVAALRGEQQEALSAVSPPLLSLTRALNNASNRAVRRILLARSWPSAEALNLSLRRSAEAEKEREEQLLLDATEATPTSTSSDEEGSGFKKCPVPRPILNVLTRRRKQKEQLSASAEGGSSSSSAGPTPRSRFRTNEEYVADQIKAFRERYDTLAGYPQAEAYLLCILSLATSGIEAPPDIVEQVLKAGVYDESYKRVLAVLNRVGIVFEVNPETGRNQISSQLIDQDICLSVLDKLRMRQEESSSEVKLLVEASLQAKSIDDSNTETSKAEEAEDAEPLITREDLGGVLLSAEEPSVTRQLNVLSNIVQRALLFGGDQELLVLADTLDADRKAFVERWYPITSRSDDDDDDENKNEKRPGVQFLNCLVRLLRDCYDNGVVTDLDPPLPLSKSYANSYERLVAGAVELGSGYLKPIPTDAMTMPKPRTAKEELGRFAVWESTFRQSSSPNDAASSYPEDLEGVWEVQDEIGGEQIGKSTVLFREQGKVEVAPPLEGLRWRLDPGPTHLDTCTFQVLSSDGTILQYRGFIDRGARLESRFSKRPLRMRGSVMFQMRDGSIDYYKDMLPINYRTGTTQFVMTRQSGR